MHPERTILREVSLRTMLIQGRVPYLGLLYRKKEKGARVHGTYLLSRKANPGHSDPRKYDLRITYRGASYRLGKNDS